MTIQSPTSYKKSLDILLKLHMSCVPLWKQHMWAMHCTTSASGLLKQSLTNSCVTGTLPQSWGGNGSFAALQDLQLSSCGIQGNMVFMLCQAVQVLMQLLNSLHVCRFHFDHYSVIVCNCLCPCSLSMCAFHIVLGHIFLHCLHTCQTKITLASSVFTHDEFIHAGTHAPLHSR